MVEQILANINVAFDSAEGVTITPDALATFDVHNLLDQYKTDLQYFSYFTLLEKEARKLLRTEELLQDELESDLFSRIFEAMSDGKKPTNDAVKKTILLDPDYRKRNRRIVELKNQLDTLVGIISVLTVKGIALNVLTARDKAEVMSGLR